MDSDNEDYYMDDTYIDHEEEDENEFSDSSTPKSEVIDMNKQEQVENDDNYDLDNLSDAQTTELSDDEEETKEEYVNEVLDAGEVVKHMNDCIREVNVVLQLPLTFTRVLLNHFKWDKDKLIDGFYEGDEEKLFSDVKILLPFKSQITSANEHSDECSSKSKVKISANECEICYLPVTANVMMGLQCGHTFCDSCWDRYLTTKIMDEGSVEIITCAAHDCNSLVDDETVMKFVKDPNVKSKYQHLITNSFVECNKLLHWCTAKNCNYVIKVQYFDAKPVICKCSNVFCFACGENGHDPIPCKWMKSWKMKIQIEGKNLKWIAAHTKNCPKCYEPIEKNGGCNHMTCRKCKYHFCWACLRSLQGHNMCNRFDEQATEISRNANIRKSKASMDCFLFYSNRYENHMNSLKFEDRLHLSIGKKMEQMQQSNMSWADVQFLKKAVDILCQCRQTLMCTYVFAFFLQKNNQSIIFEDNQNDLEKATEKLSEYLENYLNLDDVDYVKLKVEDKLRYCQTRRNVLIDHVHEGFKSGLWFCNDTGI